MEIESVAWLTFLRKSMWAECERGSGKSGEQERSSEQEAAEQRAGVTKIGLNGEREIGRSRSAHAPLTLRSHALHAIEWPYTVRPLDQVQDHGRQPSYIIFSSHISETVHPIQFVFGSKVKV